MIAAVFDRFPKTTQTFHARRLGCLHRDGRLGGIWHARPGDGQLPPECEHLIDLARAIDAPRPSDVAAAAPAAAAAARHLRSSAGEGGPRAAAYFALRGAALGRELRERSDVTRIHAPFSTAAATIAVVAGEVADLPVSVEVHSPLSMFRSPAWLAWKLRRADVIVSISDYTTANIEALGVDPGNIRLVRCGVPPLDQVPRGDADVDLIAVGSLIEKKGHRHAIEAAATLDRHLTIVGGGPLEPELASFARSLGAAVDLRGPLPPSETLALTAAARVSVLGCVRTADGDEDGIPVSLMEALQLGVPVASTDVAGIPELVGPGQGALATPGDGVALAAAIDAATRLGEATLPTAFHQSNAERDLARVLGLTS